MLINRNATAVWNGTGKEGNGKLTTASTVLDQTQYSFNTRFADGIGTNPEELVAAAHAGCFAMKLSFSLSAAGFTADEITAKSTVSLDTKADTITKIHLTVSARVPGISAEAFAPIAEGAKQNCLISKLLNAELTMEASLA
ncbi:MAG: OsmC family protein [Cytophagaceae bacterium]|nr:OsmC family protein [Cytophagaceae bacterium]